MGKENILFKMELFLRDNLFKEKDKDLELKHFLLEINMLEIGKTIYMRGKEEYYVLIDTKKKG